MTLADMDRIVEKLNRRIVELEDELTTAKAMGAHEAGRDHAPAIAELVEKNTRLQKAVDDARRWLAKLHPKCKRLGSGAEGRCPVCRALDATVAAPAADTPETVAEKAKAARAVGDRFKELFGGKK